MSREQILLNWFSSGYSIQLAKISHGPIRLKGTFFTLKKIVKEQ